MCDLVLQFGKLACGEVVPPPLPVTVLPELVEELVELALELGGETEEFTLRCEDDGPLIVRSPGERVLESQDGHGE
jgi:hypothetical protein